MFSANRSILKKILQCNIKNVKTIEMLTICQIGTRNRNYYHSYNLMPVLKNTLEQDAYEKYKSHVYYIVEYLTTGENELLKEESQILKNILNYNLPSHIQDTGPLVVSTYKNFVPPEKLTSKSLDVVHTIAWSHDLIIRGFEMMDDVMDSSKTRNNIPCWHQVDNIGIKAVNDALVVIQASCMLIKPHLFGHPSYLPILELTNETIYKIALGQILEVSINCELFTMERWKTVAKHRGTFGAVIDPIIRGMYLAEVFDKKLHYEVKDFLMDLGEYFAVQNDILDCYGNSTVTGKYGNDIPEGKCSWLAIQALADGNSSQRELFKKYYGKSDEASQEAIREMYNELNLYEKFLMYEEESYKKLHGRIEELSEAIPKEFMHKVIDTYYGKI